MSVAVPGGTTICLYHALQVQIALVVLLLATSALRQHLHLALFPLHVEVILKSNNCNIYQLRCQSISVFIG